MKIISHFHGCLINQKIVLKPVDEKDYPIIQKLFDNKKTVKVGHNKRFYSDVKLMLHISIELLSKIMPYGFW